MKQEKESDVRTIFVRGVNYATGDAEFADFFSSIGPIKTAFLVKSDGQKGNKGFGFVQFALEEDAQRAINELHGSELDGKKLKVESALKRASFDERKKKRKRAEDDADHDASEGEADEDQAPIKVNIVKKKVTPAPPPSAGIAAGPAAAAAASDKHASVRTIAIGGLASSKDVDAALDKAAGCGKVETVVKKAGDDVLKRFKLAQDGCTGHVALVTFTSVKEALDGVAALHGQTLGDKGGARVWARQLSGEGLHIKRWRLVVRNLSFKATEADLRSAFSSAGFVWEVKLPRGPDGNSRGFAFVGFQCKADAEKAIKKVNAQVVAGRPVAVDWALSKRDYDAAVAEVEGGPTAAAAATASGSESESDEEMGLSSDEDQIAAGEGKGVIAGHESDDDNDMDIAPEVEKQMLHGVLDDILGGKDSKKKGEEDAPPVSKDPFNRANLAGAQGQEAVERLEQQAKRREEMAARRSEGGGTPCTVFVRGLPLDVVKEQVEATMRTYGPLRACRLVMNKDTGKPRGTAFVEFRDERGATAAAQACARGRSGDGLGVIIAGRKVDVDPALGGDDVRALAVSRTKDGDGDKRNTYLAKEGRIEEGSAAWEEMSASDQTKRKHAIEESRAKLKNPNYIVSATRLSIRNIPRSWTEKQLKSLSITAVKERAAKAQPKVVQTKILVGEQGKSKGIGFIEFDQHEHALCALRQLNNNPKAWGKDHRPIVEFAFDDARIMQKRKARLSMEKQAQQSADAPQGDQPAPRGQRDRPVVGTGIGDGDGDGDDGEGPSMSKRQLRKERRLMLKQRAAKKEASDDNDGDDYDADGGQQEDKGNVSKAKAKRRRQQRAAKRGKPVEPAVNGAVEIKDKPAAKRIKKSEEPAPAKAAPSKAAAKVKAVKTPKAAGVGAKPVAAKPKRRKVEKDGFDTLVDKYMKKVDPAQQASSAGAGQTSHLKRWFE